MDADRLEQLADKATPGPWEWITDPREGRLLVAGWDGASHWVVTELPANEPLIALAPQLARDHAALLRWAENAREVIEADAVEAFGPLLAALDDLKVADERGDL